MPSALAAVLAVLWLYLKCTLPVDLGAQQKPVWWIWEDNNVAVFSCCRKDRHSPEAQRTVYD